MSRTKIKIKDSNIAHCSSTSMHFNPTHFDWVRDNEPVDEFTIISDSDVTNYGLGIVWMLEPRSVVSDKYAYVEGNYNKFNKILTYDKRLLEKCPNAKMLEFGSTRLTSEQIKLHPKSRLCSMMASQKSWTTGHIFRHKCVNECQTNFKDKVDLFIANGYNYIDKFDACEKYMFSIVVENGKFDYYFSEKLIDCLLSGVVPIYWGCPSIGDFFNTDGMLIFDDINDLNEILNNISKEEYIKRKDAIKENFEKAHKYMITEDRMFDLYSEVFGWENNKI